MGAELFHEDGRTDGQTDRPYEDNSRFSQFFLRKAPKNEIFTCYGRQGWVKMNNYRSDGLARQSVSISQISGVYILVYRCGLEPFMKKGVQLIPAAVWIAIKYIFLTTL